MNYLDTIKEAHDLVCKARNLLDELRTPLADDKDILIEVDQIIIDWVEGLQDIEDPLFSGCNIEHINELPKKLEEE